jgi:hypothetical protein
MPTEKNRSLQKAVFLLCLIFLFQGCAMLAESRKRREELVEKIEKQKKAYLDLKKDLQDKVLKVGSYQRGQRFRPVVL